MASRDTGTDVRNASDGSGTVVRINKERYCQKVFGKKYCTPWVKHDAHIHLGPGPAQRLSYGVGAAAEAVAKTLAATGVGAPAAPWIALAGALVVIGYEALKNDDGSIEIYVNNVAARAGQARVPVHIDPTTCAAILQAM